MNTIKNVLIMSFFSLAVLCITVCDVSGTYGASSTPGNSSVIRDAIQTGKNTATIFFEGSQKITEVSDSNFIIKGETAAYTITKCVIEEGEITYPRKFTNKVTVSPDFINGDIITIEGTNKMHGWAEFTASE